MERQKTIAERLEELGKTAYRFIIVSEAIQDEDLYRCKVKVVEGFGEDADGDEVYTWEDEIFTGTGESASPETMLYRLQNKILETYVEEFSKKLGVKEDES